MLHKHLKDILKAFKFDLDSYKSFAEARRIYLFFMKVFGTTVLTYRFDNNNRLVTKLSLLGACGFVLWNSLYFYNAYVVYLEDQTVLRYLHDTKLKHYGDDLSRFVSIVFVVYMMWKIPLHLSGNTLLIQNLFDIDEEMEKLGVIANYAEFAYFTLITGMGQMTVVFLRFLSLWLVHKHMSRAILVQVGYSDSIAMIYTTHLAFALIFLRERYKILNKTLNEIKNRTDLIFAVPKLCKQVKSKDMLHQDRLISFKIRVCSKIYGKLYKASGDLNNFYGFSTTITMFFSLLYIILNLFYLMEATASGLFHDIERYTNFVIYVFWQISYALGIIFLIIYFCVSVVEEARRTSLITHGIINANWGPEITEEVKNILKRFTYCFRKIVLGLELFSLQRRHVNATKQSSRSNTELMKESNAQPKPVKDFYYKEAMQLSMQLLHQKPEFTASRMVNLDYELLFQGGRTVATILVTLLQFVTD